MKKIKLILIFLILIINEISGFILYLLNKKIIDFLLIIKIIFKLLMITVVLEIEQ